MRSQGLADSHRGPDEAVAYESESESRKLDADIRVSRTRTRMSSLGLEYCDLTYRAFGSVRADAGPAVCGDTLGNPSQLEDREHQHGRTLQQPCFADW